MPGSQFSQAATGEVFPGGHLDAVVINGGQAYSFFEPNQRVNPMHLGQASSVCLAPHDPSTGQECVIRATAAGLVRTYWQGDELVHEALGAATAPWAAATQLTYRNGRLFGTAGNQLMQGLLDSTGFAPLPNIATPGPALDVIALDWNDVDAVAVLTPWYFIIQDLAGNIQFFAPMADSNARMLLLKGPTGDGVGVLQQNQGLLEVGVARPNATPQSHVIGSISYTTALAMDVDGVSGDDIVLFNPNGQGSAMVLNRLSNGDIAHLGELLQTTAEWAPEPYLVKSAMAADFDADGDVDFVTFEQGPSPAVRINWASRIDELAQMVKLKTLSYGPGIAAPESTAEQIEVLFTLPDASNLPAGHRTEVRVHGWFGIPGQGVERTSRVNPLDMVWPNGPGATNAANSMTRLLNIPLHGLESPSDEWYLLLRTELFTFAPGSTTPTVYPVRMTSFSPFEELATQIAGGDPWVDPDGIGGQSQSGQTGSSSGEPALPL